MVDGFKWIENTSQFNKDFIKNYNEDSEEGYFLEAYFQYSENFLILHNDLLFLPEIMKSENIGKLAANLRNKENSCYTYKKFKTITKLWIIIEKSS